MITNIFFFSPFVCVVLFIIIISQSKKIDKLENKLALQDVPEIIKMKQEKHELEQKETKARITKINLEIDERINKGEFYIKVPRKPLLACLRAHTDGYVFLKFADRKLEIINSGTSKIEIMASWQKLK